MPPTDKKPEMHDDERSPAPSRQEGTSETSPQADPAPSRSTPKDAGKYRLLAELGQGGMANVYLAVARGPSGFNKLVVLKCLRSDLASNKELLAMFLDEARLAARLNHPHVVQTNEVGEYAGRPVMVMEYLEGQTLANLVDRAGPDQLPLALHLRVIVDALEGLDHAHELADFAGRLLGLVHRDVSPQNVFVTFDGQVKVLDFGIAKVVNSQAQTSTGVLKGKVHYMAPEQMWGDKVDRRADLYAVGVMAWEAATGRRMWKGHTDLHVMHKVANEGVPKASEVNPNVSPALEAVVMKALARDPNDRYATALEFGAALETVIDQLGTGASSRNLGKVVRDLFAEERKQTRKIIEAQLLEAENTDTGQPLIPPNLVRISTRPPDSGVGGTSSGLAGNAVPRVRSKRRWFFAAGGAIGIASAVGLLRARTSPCAPVKVRMLPDLSGPVADVGVPLYWGQIDSFREINANGGIGAVNGKGGCMIEWETHDTKYDTALAQGVYNEWKARPDWADVVALFDLGSNITLALGTQEAEDHKVAITGSYNGAIASPIPIDIQQQVPEVESDFSELTFSTQFKSPGYPFDFFAGTDYSTGIRIAMFHIKSLGGKRVGFFHNSAAYGTGPVPAGRMYAKTLGLEIGRDLILENTENQATYDNKVLTYFQAEQAHAAAAVPPGSYAMVDWVWGGNATKTMAQLALAIDKMNKTLGLKVQGILNNWGFDENLYGPYRCGDACVGTVHGIMPMVPYGDLRETEMAKVVQQHDKWRAIDQQNAAGADGGASGNARAPVSYRNVRYVQGYVSALMFRIAAERVLANGQKITGDTLKAALETFRNVETGGLTDKLTFTPTDHRGQSTESIYKISSTGSLVYEPPDRRIFLENSWLGW